MSLKLLRYIIPFFILLVLYSCSATKFIPDGEYLLDKVKIESDVSEYGSIELRPYLRQKPNYKMFGINKTMLQIYNLAGKNDSKWINRFIKKIGEEPVIFDSTLVEKTDSEFNKFFVNKGYINAEVSSEVIKKGKKADVIYKIKGNTPYTIRNYTYTIQDKTLRQTLFGEDNKGPITIPEEALSIRIPSVKQGMLFDRGILDNERTRITTLLRNRGYYAFNKSYITYDADSSLNMNAVDVNLIINRAREPQPDGVFQEINHQKYKLNNIYLYLDYDPLRFSSLQDYPKTDSIVSENYTVYYQGKKPSISPKTLINNTFFSSGKNYSEVDENLTYSSFSRLNALNNIYIQFNELTQNDSALIDCSILTIPARKQTISFSLEGTNTAGDLGIAPSISYTHRNLFRGAETLNLKIRGAYEAITQNSAVVNPYWELGGEASIHLPKFVFPFINSSFLRRMNTSTEFTLSYNYQTRPEYDRTLLSGGVRYIWQNTNRSAGRHQFDLLDIDYVYFPKIDPTFLSELPPNAELFGYIDQFIAGSGYTFTKTTFDPMQKQRNAYSLRLSLESAGNALSGIMNLFNSSKDENGFYTLLNNRFAQFVKGDFDYAKTIIFDEQNSLAMRIGGGIGFPYGNSQMLPFEKRYYSGGANSVRAWSVRELGPGGYQPNESTTFFHQSGDIKLDFNLEYRTRFFWKLEAAAFIDAGNIWTIKDYPDQEEGQFKFNQFFKQIAWGYGLGLRLDFDFFLIRFDFGWKAFDPSKRGKERWAITNPNFTNNFAWHIAVGYPF